MLPTYPVVAVAMEAKAGMALLVEPEAREVKAAGRQMRQGAAATAGPVPAVARAELAQAALEVPASAHGRSRRLSLIPARTAHSRQRWAVAQVAQQAPPHFRLVRQSQALTACRLVSARPQLPRLHDFGDAR